MRKQYQTPKCSSDILFRSRLQIEESSHCCEQGSSWLLDIFIYVLCVKKQLKMSSKKLEKSHKKPDLDAEGIREEFLRLF